jgi:hypothetical protein
MQKESTFQNKKILKNSLPTDPNLNFYLSDTAFLFVLKKEKKRLAKKRKPYSAIISG